MPKYDDLTKVRLQWMQDNLDLVTILNRLRPCR
jgi:hypothetical protein